MLSVASRSFYDPRKDRAPDNTSPEWAAGLVYLASRDDRYRPRDDAEKAAAKAESLIREGLDFVSRHDISNARLCYSLAARFVRQTGSDEVRKNLFGLDGAICGLDEKQNGLTS